jgi:hypothetical protein
MSSPAPRQQLPEPLSGVPEEPVVELGAGRPWLTLSEINRLVRQQGLAPALARAWLLDELVRAIPLDPEREQQLIRAWVEAQGVHSEEELDAWLAQQQLRRGDLRLLATQAERLERFRQHRWGPDVEVEFLRRKPQLDQAVYSLLRVSDQALAEELHQRIAEGETDFSTLASRHAEGRERHSRGLIGPLPLAQAHPEIAGRLRVGQPGQLWPPFAVEGVWVLLRLEEQLPARLNTQTRSRMMGELFETWLQERVQWLLAGEPVPPLPPLPAATEELPLP